MTPPIFDDPGAFHLPDRSCCDVVRHAVTSAALDGRELDRDWTNTLHDVATGRRTADEVVDEVVGDVLRRYGETRH